MADDKTKQGQTGTATLEPEHHQTQAAADSPQAGAKAQAGQTSAKAATGAAASPQGSSSPGSSSRSGSSTNPWNPGSTSGSGSSSLSRREPSFSPLGPLGFANPFALVDRLFDDFLGHGPGRLWSPGLFSSSRDLGRSTGPNLWYPQVEVRERDGKLVVCADLPGARKEDVHVEVRDNALILEGERREESEEDREGFYRSERSYGRFFRTIPLPEGVNPDQAEASFKDGVLEVSLPLPKREPAQGRKIEVR
jgi:HSP20 family protein